MASCGIYRITNKLNGKFYIGSSDNIERRWKEGHRLSLTKGKHGNQHLQNAWSKYGKDAFVVSVMKLCPKDVLLVEEQKELDVWVGKKECYNMCKLAGHPVAPGEKRPQWIVDKIAAAQRGIPKWTEEQKKQMSLNRMGIKHKPETIVKFKNRPKLCYTGIIKAQQINVGRIYSSEHCSNIRTGKIGQTHNLEIRTKISEGVQKALSDGRGYKNKIPKTEYEGIKVLYVSGQMNKRQLALKYGINPSSMQKLLQRIGV